MEGNKMWDGERRGGGEKGRKFINNLLIDTTIIKHMFKYKGRGGGEQLSGKGMLKKMGRGRKGMEKGSRVEREDDREVSVKRIGKGEGKVRFLYNKFI